MDKFYRTHCTAHSAAYGAGRDGSRRPQFKQVLQDMEHQGFVEHRARLEKEIRETLSGSKFGVNADDVIRGLFSTMSPPLKEYRKMAWVVLEENAPTRDL